MRLFARSTFCVGTVLMVGSVTAFAYDDDKKKEQCRHPKVQEFSLPEYGPPNSKEAPAEAEFSFIVSPWGDHKKFKLSAKGVDIPLTVQSNDSFHKVTAKLPPGLTGQIIRINARIPALLGCYTTLGWLVKVGDKSKAAVQPTTPPAVQDMATPTPAPAASKVVTAPSQNNVTPKE
jgi:hypothetical protein